MNLALVKQLMGNVQQLQNELADLPGVALSEEENANATLTLDHIVTDHDLHQVVAKLFNNGHHARAVEEAFKFLNNLVKRKTGITNQDGAPLMQYVSHPKNHI